MLHESTPSDLSDDAGALSPDAAAALHELTRTMNDRLESAAQVAALLAEIDHLAFEANLMVLDATLESGGARASAAVGTHTAEIRRLARHTAASAQQTSWLLRDPIGPSLTGRARLRHAADAIRHMAAGVKDLTRLVTGRGVEQANLTIS
ncbi:MAG: hypothetical protein IT178_11230 [Acidobacteria bacterium]|nr:hypothetical protein [Acidobacteriota bacterium]